MVSLLTGTFLACMFEVIYGQVDTILTSPDVDINTGFFPDSGYLNAQPQSVIDDISSRNNDQIMSNEIRLQPVADTKALLSKRLQQLLSRLSGEKTIKLENKQRPRASPTQDHHFLHLFTGFNGNKG